MGRGWSRSRGIGRGEDVRYISLVVASSSARAPLSDRARVAADIRLRARSKIGGSDGGHTRLRRGSALTWWRRCRCTAVRRGSGASTKFRPRRCPLLRPR